MPGYLHPGVYIEESRQGPKPIEGVPTSTAAFIGETERGPTQPRLVTSYVEYQRWYGGVFGNTKYMPYAVSGFFENGGRRLYICRITNHAATTAAAPFGNFQIKAMGPGIWGRRVYVKVEDSSTKRQSGNAVVPIGVKIRIAYYSATPTGDPLDWFNDPSKPPFPDTTETFDDLDAEETSPNYWNIRLFERSTLIEVNRTDGPPNTLPAKMYSQLAINGCDGGALDVNDFIGLPIPPLRSIPQGLSALELDPYCGVALVYAPGQLSSVNKAVISHCENMRFRFAVVDTDKNVDLANFQPRESLRDTAFAAIYHPWIVIPDPHTGTPKIVPPGGHVLGVFARIDSERGVFKAPANEILHGVLDLTAHIDDATQDVLNPSGINAIRKFAKRGIRVWGARTLASDALWKYVSVRRLFMFLEHSIHEGTQWAMFEPNDDRLWARVSDTIRLFLRAQWRGGALLGRTEEEAFFITCDRTTMTQNDIVSGRLICEIGIAPVRPAQFVIFRILQNTAEAQ